MSSTSQTTEPASPIEGTGLVLGHPDGGPTISASEFGTSAEVTAPQVSSGQVTPTRTLQAESTFIDGDKLSTTGRHMSKETGPGTLDQARQKLDREMKFREVSVANFLETFVPGKDLPANFKVPVPDVTTSGNERAMYPGLVCGTSFRHVRLL